MEKNFENIFTWSPTIKILQPPNIKIITNCLFALSEIVFEVNEPSKCLKIGSINKEYAPKTDLLFIQFQKNSDKIQIKPILLAISKEGDLNLENVEKESYIYLNFLYIFSPNCKNITPINEIAFVYNKSLVFFQGEYNFTQENPKSSFFFEISPEYTPEIDLVGYHCRKSKENHCRLVVHSSGIIQIKPQVNVFLNSCYLLKGVAEQNKKVSIKFSEKNPLVSCNYIAYVIDGIFVIIQGLLEYEQEENQRVIGFIDEFLPKNENYFINCLKEKWDFTIVNVKENGEINSCQGKSIWLNIFYFI